MAAGPQRRAQRAPHLMAQIAPVELALKARADFLSLRASQRNAINEAFIIRNGLDAKNEPDIESAVDERVAEEFRALAEELHWWG